MRIEAIELTNFRRYEKALFEVSPQGLAWVGPNASGKTTLLEAIHKVAILKGFGREEEMLRWGASWYRVRLRLSEGLAEMSYERGKGTQLIWNGSPVSPLSQWLGRLPIVSLRPADVEWIESGAEARRRWSNKILSQLSPEYFAALYAYQRATDQRNALLAQGNVSPVLLEPWEAQMIRYGTLIQTKRLALVEALQPALQTFYSQFGSEKVKLEYRLTCEPSAEGWHHRWRTLHAQEQQKARTLLGPHREDFALYLQGKLARTHASEGQKKSLLIALKWAEAQHLQQLTLRGILLLLDDIGEKLDRMRLSAVGQLSRLAMQTFLTDVEERRVRDAFPELPIHFLEPPEG
ncbi:MAG: DNA replication and repair protein RecF [Bacteroidia bacterium]|nr:DNA replication and repair protein RecF [Bacteroidia bacterium]MDW8236285.1 DNA replication and repair protein RecF [Bacteroidia bacterium]